jgi:hypothetical protein
MKGEFLVIEASIGAIGIAIGKMMLELRNQGTIEQSTKSSLPHALLVALDQARRLVGHIGGQPGHRQLRLISA